MVSREHWVEHLKGKVKEKAGWLTDRSMSLESDGKSDQVKSDVKENVDKAGDTVKAGSTASDHKFSRGG